MSMKFVTKYNKIIDQINVSILTNMHTQETILMAQFQNYHLMFQEE